MPGKRASLFPLLLPAVICVPVSAALIVLLVSTWHGADARAAADARRSDAALRAQGALVEVVQRQAAVTEHLGRSPLVWLWVKFQGEHLTASNRYHAELSLAEIANYSGLLPGSAISMGSSKTGLLYRDGAPARTLSKTNPEDAWYFAALSTDSVLTLVEGTTVRTSTRLMDGGSLLGVISCVRSSSDIAAEVFPAVLAQHGITAALADQHGSLLFASTPGGSSAQTLPQLFPGPSPDSLASFIASAAKGAGPASMELVSGGRIMGLTAVKAGPIGGSILVAAEVPAALPWTRLALLILAPALSLALIIGILSAIAARRIGSVSALLGRRERESDAARTAFTRIDASARSVRSAATNLRSLVASLGREAGAGETSGAEAATLFRRAEEQDTELRAGMSARLELLDRLADAIRAALAQSRGAQAALLSVGPDAAQAEEELSRIITLGSSAAGAVQRAAKGAESLAEAAGRLNLMAVNASLEAVRAGPAGQRLTRVADEVRGLADDASGRARILTEALAEAGQRLAGATHAAQTAGQSVHAAAAAAESAATGPSEAWEETSAVLAKMESSGISAARLREQADHADRSRSVLEGMTSILARIRALAGQAADLAGSVASDAEGAARAASAIMKEYGNDE
jgi:methyl-accepting chemotaxis protein